jgi:hypothetical protein
MLAWRLYIPVTFASISLKLPRAVKCRDERFKSLVLVRTEYGGSIFPLNG